jgi:SAM-dependent methyltransferase
LDPQTPEQREREDADVETSSEDYARRFAGGVGAYFLETQAKATLDLLRGWPRASVLDVGGGHGQVTGPLVDAGHDVTILGSAEVCRERVRTWVEAGRARFQAGNLLQLPFADDSFEIALSYRLLPHVAEWPRLIGELARVARSVVLVDYPTVRSVNVFSGFLFGVKKGIERDTRSFRVFKDSEIAQAFATQGFRPTARRPQFFLPMALHRAIGIAALARALEGAAAGVGMTRLLGSPVLLRLEPRG